MTPEQKIKNDNIAAIIQAELHPGEGNETRLSAAASKFMGDYVTRHKDDKEYKDHPELFEKKIAEVQDRLEQSLIQKAQEGAEKGASPESFSADEKNKNGGMKEFLGGAIDWIMDSMFGGLVGGAWHLLEKLPFVGNLMDKFSNWISDARTNQAEKTAAGAASGLEDVKIDGIADHFVLDKGASGELYEKMKGRDLSKPVLAGNGPANDNVNVDTPDIKMDENKNVTVTSHVKVKAADGSEKTLVVTETGQFDAEKKEIQFTQVKSGDSVIDVAKLNGLASLKISDADMEKGALKIDDSLKGMVAKQVHDMELGQLAPASAGGAGQGGQARST